MAKKTIIIDNHILMPKHAILSEKEKKTLLEKYNISQKQLPKMMISDPALANLKVKAGDIIKITRKSPTAGEHIFYRGIINA